MYTGEDQEDDIAPEPEWIVKIVNLLGGLLNLPLHQDPFNLNKDTADRIQRLVLALLDGELSPEAFILEMRMAFRFVPLYRPTPHWVPLFQVCVPVIRQMLQADATQRTSLLAQLIASSETSQEQSFKDHAQDLVELQQQRNEWQKPERPQPPKRSSSLLYLFSAHDKSAPSQFPVSSSLYAPQSQQNIFSSQHSNTNGSTTDLNSRHEVPICRATLPRNPSETTVQQQFPQQQQQATVQEKQQKLQQLHSWVESQAQHQLQAQPQLQLQPQPQLQPLAQPQQQRQEQFQLLQSQQQRQFAPQGQYHQPKLQSQQQQQQQKNQLQQQDPVVSLTRASSQLQLILAEQREIYVRASRIAELSPYFARNWLEDSNIPPGQRPLMLDDTYENVLEMLRCIIPCELNGYELKPITVCNFPTLVRMADKYSISRLMARCEEFVIQDFKREKVEEATVLTMLKTAASARQFSKEALAEIIGRAATFDIAVLKSANLLSLPPNVSNALHFAKHDYAMNGPEKSVKFDDTYTDSKFVPCAKVDKQLLQ
uniref:TAFH domain-containing protein n=1 Tax=Plectus sambesii TaxID=2011161 RepID=A0A914V199_9BILA